MDLNSVNIIGRLTRDAELKYTNEGKAVSNFSIAVHKRKTEGCEDTDYFDVTVWNKHAESVHPYLVKGKMVCIEGRLRQNRWTHDGQNKSRVEIAASYIQFLGGGQKGENGYLPENKPPHENGDVPF
jgi:single-strand DNA-binding protein